MEMMVIADHQSQISYFRIAYSIDKMVHPCNISIGQLHCFLYKKSYSITKFNASLPVFQFGGDSMMTGPLFHPDRS
ncbi:MAG: hypothetical protein ACK562_15160, partial [Acidobacteriota bacterium]